MLRVAEVSNDGETLFVGIRHEDVLKLNVSMHNSFAMQVIESFSYLKDHCFYSVFSHRFEAATFHVHV